MRGTWAFAAAVALWAVLAAISVEPVPTGGQITARRAATTGRVGPVPKTTPESDPAPPNAAQVAAPADRSPAETQAAATTRDVASTPPTETTTKPPQLPTLWAFDTCEAPSPDQMRAWRSSPYRAIGIYIGGQMRHCRNASLDDRAWMDAVVGQGWHVLPIYVGPQAPCTRFWTQMDSEHATEHGLAVGDDAVGRASAAGLPAGAPIYYDLEAYQSRDPSCDQVVKAFLHAFVVRLHERGYVAGLYSSLSSGIRAQSAAIADPAIAPVDAIWVASWDNQASLTGMADLPDTAWSHHQRVKQYIGDHKESWGGVELDVDSNLVDGPVYPAR